MVVAPTGALTHLGHIKKREKHLILIGSLKVRERKKKPNVTSFSPNSRCHHWLFATEQAGAGCPSPSMADILCDYCLIVLFHVLQCWLWSIFTFQINLSWCIVTEALRGSNTHIKKFILFGLGLVKSLMSRDNRNKGELKSVWGWFFPPILITHCTSLTIIGTALRITPCWLHVFLSLRWHSWRLPAKLQLI